MLVCKAIGKSFKQCQILLNPKLSIRMMVETMDIAIGFLAFVPERAIFMFYASKLN